jgi:hypothetical protein
MRTAGAVLLLCLTVPLMHSQETKPPNHQQESAATENEAATRQDIQRMKALVQQMQTNLASVTSTQGPLKHQFELEIEMWQLEISRMERQLGGTPVPQAVR